MSKFNYHVDGKAPRVNAKDADSTYFVFGSNLAGIHGAGAARAALEKYGAEVGNGKGFQGKSYAIPTKDENIKTLPLSEIAKYVSEFVKVTNENPDKKFFVTRVGCVLAGYSDREIAPMFAGSNPENTNFAEEWQEYLE